MRLAVQSAGGQSLRFQSTHSLRSATGESWIPGNHGYRFNPRTPCGVRRIIVHGRLSYTGFQSTHSLRSATGAPHRGNGNNHSFNPRTPCGVRHNPLLNNELQHCFNPRTPCGVRRSDDARPNAGNWFQSTHSLRSATVTS